MTTRLKITLLISVVALAFILGLTVDWWAGGLLALVAGLFGRAVVPRDDAVSNRPDSPDHRPTEYVDPDTDLEEIDDEITDETTDAVGAAADEHNVPDDTVASDLEWADSVRRAGPVSESGEGERGD